MNEKAINQEAAKSLVERAMESRNQSTATLLIGAACRLDASLSEEDLQKAWLEKWLKNNENRRK
jgi:hypothetical protein